MSAADVTGVDRASSTDQSGHHRTALILRAAWLSVGLGIIIEIAVLGVLLTSGNAGGIRAELAGAAERISWPVLVCVAIVFAQTSGRIIASASALTMGVAGLLAAPMTVTITKMIHKGMTTALGVATDGTNFQILMAIGVVRALEYATLAVGFTLLARRSGGSAVQCALVGFGVGAVFGGIAMTLTVGRNDDAGASQYIAAGLNELILPIGCSLILYATKIMAERLTPI